MASEAWKTVERMVAALLGGVRSWETDHDVLVVTHPEHYEPSKFPQVLMELHRMGAVRLASIEVKNLKAPTIAMVEGILAKNQQKIDRDIPGAANALVVKRKAGAGRKTPYLLIVPLEVPDGS